jgi:hypothetical protein
VIVCENDGADWLDFQPLTSLAGQLHTQKEVLWYREANISEPVELKEKVDTPKIVRELGFY